MNVCKNQIVAKNIYCIKAGIANMYLIKHHEKYIAIDCGAKIKQVEKGLTQFDIKADDVSHVFLTHSDYDHVAYLPFFNKAKVYMGHEEEQMIDKTTPRFSSFRFNKELDCEHYELLYDRQAMQIANVNIQCIATPGHTPGSLSYLINDQYLFVGDAMSIKKGKIGPFTSMFVMDMETHLNSIEKIRNVKNAKMIFTGHHGYVIL